MFNFILKFIMLFSTGGMLYGIIETLFRGFSHISMFIAGGICFVFIGLLDESRKIRIPFIMQMLISSVIITAVELVTGMIVNIGLNLNVWDYSYIPFNYKGQICLLFSIMWFFLSGIGIILEDLIRIIIFKENNSLLDKFAFKRNEQTH